MLITVFGGAGRLGRLVADGLVHAGHKVRVVGRHVTPSPGSVAGSIADGEVVGEALIGADAAIIIVESDESGSGPNGPERVHLGGLRHVIDTTDERCRIVLVSQIYITRPERMPSIRAVIEARAAAEELLRRSGHPFAIIRPAWLTDGPAGPVRFEQGDTGDGVVSRASIARCCIDAVTSPAPVNATFEVFDDAAGSAEWLQLSAQLAPDRE